MMESPKTCTCGAELGPDQWLCKACDERRAQRFEAEREQARRRELIAAVARPLTNAPNWPWCTVDNPDFQRRVKAPLRKFAAHWMPSDGSELILGDSGDGKTSAALAMLKRLGQHYLEQDTKLPPRTPERRANAEALRQFAGALWTKAHDLALARRLFSKFGSGEAELVERAVSASILVVDEVGPEPLTEVLFYVVDARYSQQRRTIVTSGLRPDAFRERYGDAMWRRLTEKGIGDLIDTGGRSG